MKDDSIYIEHIIEAIDKIMGYIKQISEKTFLETPLVQDAVIRQFEIIGEATKHISETFRKRHPDIPWEKMAGMRDKLIHDYIDVDLWVIWDTAKKHLPIVKKQIKKILK